MYCRKCGKELIEYPELKIVEFYSETTGEPVYRNGYMRCPDNPCHQGHIWEDVGTRWQNFLLSLMSFPCPRQHIECKICNKKSIRYVGQQGGFF